MPYDYPHFQKWPPQMKELHDLVVKCRDTLHYLDGSSIEPYTPFHDADLEEAARLMHRAYSHAVEMANRRLKTPDAA